MFIDRFIVNYLIKKSKQRGFSLMEIIHGTMLMVILPQ